MTGAIVLVVGAVDAARRRAAWERLAASVGGTVAFLQNGDPSLTTALDLLRDDGVASVRLVRAVEPDAPARSWVRRVASDWVRRNPTVDVVLDDDAVGPGAALSSPAWEDVPKHRHHVLVCRGPRCSARGSDATARALGAALESRGLGDDDVLVAQTGCLFPCNPRARGRGPARRRLVRRRRARSGRTDRRRAPRRRVPGRRDAAASGDTTTVSA